MAELTFRTVGGAEKTLANGELDTLAAKIRGNVVPVGAPHYEELRPVWNATVTRRPTAIVRCLSGADVAHTVRFAREHDLLVGVRGGGHNIAGNGLVDLGLLIDLSPMRGCRVDPARRVARADAGLTLGEFDHDTQAFGLATPLGINSTTGIAGLTLGGGYGWLSRSFGLTVDNLLGADVVTADGEFLMASTTENSDLFWAIRGGGGNFGVVTSFQFGLHPVGPQVLAGLIVHPFDKAESLLRKYRDVANDAPDGLAAWVVLRQAPPLPFLPASVHGKEIVAIAVCYAGSIEDGERALRPLRAIGTPIADVVSPMPYTAFQTTFDPLLVKGARNYWKSHNFSTLQDGLIDTVVEQVRHLPGPLTEVPLAQLGGAASRPAEDATAYAGRATRFVMNVHGRWEDPAMDDKFIGWARQLFEATKPYALSGSAYVNFMTGDEQSRVREAYGTNYDRLAAIKAKFDPTNFFRVNQNIEPAVAAKTAPSLGTATMAGTHRTS